MKSKFQNAKGPIEMMEEGFHLLRLAPAGTFLTYYIGSAPFVLGMLFFWSDMSRGSFAEERLAMEVLGVSLLFFWMKTWQAIFGRQLQTQIMAQPARRLTFKKVAHIALVQAILQPAGLFLIPIAVLLLFPIGWVYGYYQNVTALGAVDDYDFKEISRKSLKHATLWTLQNNYIVLLFKAFGLFVFFNIFTGAIAIPYLLSSLLGIQSPFVQSPSSFLNTTFFAAMFGLTYLCVDPLTKAVYVLRCFYAESRQTAADLTAELRSYAGPLAKAASIFLCAVFVILSQAPAFGAETRAAPALAPGELNHAIDEVLQKPEYTWRLPREKRLQTEEKSILAAFIDGVVEKMTAWGRKLQTWWKRFINWLNQNQGTSTGGQGLNLDWLLGIKGLIALLLAIISALLALLLLRLWKRRDICDVPELATEALSALPNLADDSVAPDQLPEDGWITMARDLLARGEMRLALRAFYLASLAHLAQRNLITIARFKSNHDYERELGRRAHAVPVVMSTFSENVSIFDRIWYGMHDVNGTLLDHFQRNFEKIKTS